MESLAFEGVLHSSVQGAGEVQYRELREGGEGRREEGEGRQGEGGGRGEGVRRGTRMSMTAQQCGQFLYDNSVMVI